MWPIPIWRLFPISRRERRPAQRNHDRADPGCSERCWLVHRGLTREAQWSQADSRAALHTMAFTKRRSCPLSKLARNDRSFAFANTGKYRLVHTEMRLHLLVQRKCEPFDSARRRIGLPT